MKNTCIVFERDENFIGRAIRWFTNSDVNHVAVEYLSNDWKEEMVFEAIPRGVWIRPSKRRKWRYVFRAKFEGVEDDTRKAGQYIDKKYDFAGFFLFIPFILAWRWFKVKLRRPLHKTKGLFCSELVAVILHRVITGQRKVASEARVMRGGVEKVHSAVRVAKAVERMETDPQWTTPQDILVFCASRPDLFDKVEVPK